MLTRATYFANIFLLLMACGFLSGCGTTSTSKAASLGAVVGGLSDGWGGAATGALVGGGVGYLVDRADDKAKAREQAERETKALEMAAITSKPETAYRPPNQNALVGTTWRMISLVSEDEPIPEYRSMVITFQMNSKVTTLTIYNDNEIETFVDSYRVVEDVLILSGEDFVVNAKYSIENSQMVLVAPGLRAVLEEIEQST
jgi:hypothetical protein